MTQEPLTPLDPEEEAAMELLGDFLQTVKGWGLRANYAELAAAVHVLQGFVIQRALHRLDPRWGAWYEPKEDR